MMVWVIIAKQDNGYDGEVTRDIATCKAEKQANFIKSTIEKIFDYDYGFQMFGTVPKLTVEKREVFDS